MSEISAEVVNAKLDGLRELFLTQCSSNSSDHALIFKDLGKLRGDILAQRSIENHRSGAEALIQTTLPWVIAIAAIICTFLVAR